MRPVIRQLAGIVVATVIAGCVYRMDIQQGNLLDPEQVDQVEVGMTRSQVRFLLGTPMVIDTFEPDRWDYVYSLRRGHSRKVAKRHLVVWFEGDKVTRIEEPIPIPRPARAAAPTPAPAAAPGSESRPADAPPDAEPSPAAG